MKVLYGKQSFDLGSFVTADLTIAQIKSILHTETHIPVDHIRLIHTGKTLSDDIYVNHLPGGVHSKLTMIASQNYHLAPIDPLERVKNDRSDDKRSDSSFDLTSKKPRNEKVFVKDGYGFHDIQTLPNLPNEDQARAILEELASDEGFLSVMKSHKWNVGCIGELYPEGYVGVSEVCVLGLNENKGQRILLRLRTDDLKGFRKNLTIREVLCHELSHMEHSNHDDKFFVLMRQIQKEVISLNWKKSQYHTLGEPIGNILDMQHRHVSARDDTELARPIQEQSLSAETAIDHKVMTEERNIVEPMEINEVLDRETDRINAEQHYQTQMLSVDSKDDSMTAEPISDLKENLEIQSLDRTSDSDIRESLEKGHGGSSNSDIMQESNAEKMTAENESNNYVYGHNADGTTSSSSVCINSSGSSSGTSYTVNSSAIMKQQLLAAIAHLDDAIAFAMAQDIYVQQEKIIKFLQHIRLLTNTTLISYNISTSVTFDEWLWAANLILTIFTNGKDSNDKKLRTLRKDTKSFLRLQQVTGGKGLEILRIGGFQDEESNKIYLRVPDPGFLYFACDILQSTIEATKIQTSE